MSDYNPRKFTNFAHAFAFRAAHHMEEVWDIVDDVSDDGSVYIVCHIDDVPHYLSNNNLLVVGE